MLWKKMRRLEGSHKSRLPGQGSTGGSRTARGTGGDLQQHTEVQGRLCSVPPDHLLQQVLLPPSAEKKHSKASTRGTNSQVKQAF